MFIYFDLGNVLLNFDHHLACRQMGEVSGLDAQQVWDVLFVPGGIKWQHETGQLSRRQFYDAFCEQTGSQPDPVAFELAGSSIFQLNASILPVVVNLEAAGHRLGILSNICESHWNYLTTSEFGNRYGILSAFDVFALSFQIGAMKPDPRIFQAAAELAGVPPQEIFYCDDIPGHVEAARAAGYDAVQYTTTPAYVAELNKRGIRFNY